MKTCSVGEVISRIYRNTRNIDSSYVDDILEWVAEAMNKLKTVHELSKTSTVLKVNQHVAVLPCDHVTTIGIEKDGVRVRLSGQDRLVSGRIPSGAFDGNMFAFDYSKPNTDKIGNVENANKDDFWKGQNIVPTGGMSLTDLVYHEQNNNYIFSFEKGEVILHYTKRPCDENGFPLVPDNENYKTAIYWYVLAMMIGSGFVHQNKEFTHGYCFQLWEMYASRALGEIKYPTVEEMEMIKNKHIRIIPMSNAYETFFSVTDNKERIWRR